MCIKFANKIQKSYFLRISIQPNKTNVFQLSKLQYAIFLIFLRLFSFLSNARKLLVKTACKMVKTAWELMLIRSQDQHILMRSVVLILIINTISGQHRSMWRFWLRSNHVLVVGVPASPYSSAMPAAVTPIYLPSPQPANQAQPQPA